MAFKIGYSFEQGAVATPNFTRDYFDTIEEMKNFPELTLPGVFITSVKETGKVYKFIKSAEPTPELGKWQEISNQYKTLPTPNESFLETVAQYTGETNDDFTKGVFYYVKKEDSGEKESATMYAWTFDGETYFTTKEIFGNEEKVDLFVKQEDDFVKVEDHFGVNYTGDGIYFDDGDDLIERAEGSDETVETPIFNYSWEALSSSGGTDEAEVKKLIKENAADADYGTENNPDLILNAASTNVGDATVDYDLAELLQDENALNDFVALLNERYLGGTVISSKYPEDHFVKDINNIKAISNGININGLTKTDVNTNIDIILNWKSLYTFSNPVEKTVSIREKIESIAVEPETEVIDFDSWN